MITATTFWAIVSAGGFTALTLAGAVYANRQYLNTMKQRLFGTELDETDQGVLVEMRADIKDIREENRKSHKAVMELLEEIDR